MNPLLLAPILDMAGKVFDKVFPDPEQAAKAKLEFTQQAAKLEQEEVQSFRDFMVAYEGSGDKVHPYIQILRGSVRPVITYFLAGAFIYGFARPTAIDDSTMTMLFNLNLLTMGFWFGEKTLRNLGLDLGKRPRPEPRD